MRVSTTKPPGVTATLAGRNCDQKSPPNRAPTRANAITQPFQATPPDGSSGRPAAAGTATASPLTRSIADTSADGSSVPTRKRRPLAKSSSTASKPDTFQRT